MKIGHLNATETVTDKVPGGIRTLERDRNIFPHKAEWQGVGREIDKLCGLLGVADALNTGTVVRWPHGTLT